MMISTIPSNLRIYSTVLLIAVLACIGLHAAEEIRPDLDYFPSRLYATIYRNWDIVPHERLATVLGTDVTTLHKAGKAMGLSIPESLTPEEIRRNVEMVLRRNWTIIPRNQIEALLDFNPQQFDDFLGKEIFLRALLAAPPADLSPIKYAIPDSATKARLQWFSIHFTHHKEAVSNTPEEPRLGYQNDLFFAHNRPDFIPETTSKSAEANLQSGWKIYTPRGRGEVLKHAVADFAHYCLVCQQTKKGSLSEASKPGNNTITLLVRPSSDVPEAYSLKIEKKSIHLESSSEIGLARGLVELEHRMAERGGPFLSTTCETNRPTFSTRCVFPYSSLMTDVLGQDLIDPCPDGYLDTIFHQDADGIWIYALLSDLVPSPVFDGMGVGGEKRLQKLRDLVNRAAKHSLKVYIYLNEPRSQPLAFFDKYPDVKGQVEGNTAALCTSTEAVQKHLRGSFEKLFREVPGLGGVFLITASENLANCYSHAHGGKTSCPRCSQRSPADVIAESIRCMAEGTWAANPKARFVVWDWSWHSVLGENVPEQIIKQLPKGVALMADFERGTTIERGGVAMKVDEYSISVVGPSPRAQLRAKQSKDSGLDFFAKVQLSTTWECGTVPFIPVPNLLARKATAMRDLNVTGAMATWTIGSYPSPNTEAFALRQWNPQLDEEDILRRIAARRYNPEAVAPAVSGWTKLSDAFTEEYPYSSAPYSGPLQHGPSLLLYRRDIPPPLGTVTLLNPKDDWTHWTAPYSPELMSKLLRHLCERWDDGLHDLQDAMEASTGVRRWTAQRDYGVAWMVGYTYRAYADDLDFYKARDKGDILHMKQIAAAQIVSTEEALRFVRADSRLGWEPELQYFYRPSDVLERLLSLDAVVDSPPSSASH
ncbi:hypothetical protein [Pedosphaera parvula]|uniref:Beta-hexosaminidase bacterial type N-terminal domain-containing protein n=1 Tax=Pedosphaera parvula (strain Ellin514) TaxID=320771 RepID=B9XMA1_PEDPL|nr:hypothetical protein [Pedosphaera parvula]EEF59094.1 hypothetical protein Cflav_PD2222 [Pedosphaera parvula Ellin514]